MRRVLLASFLATLGVALVGPAAQPAAAAGPLPAVILRTETAESTDIATQTAIVVSLFRRLEQIAQRQPARWGCVAVRAPVFGQDIDPESHLVLPLDAPPGVPPEVQTARVTVRATGIRRPGPEGMPEYGVRVRLDVKGQGGREFEILPAIEDPEAGPEQIQETLARAAAVILDELAAGMKPCTAKAKLRGKHKIEGPITFERTYSGEADVALQEDGTFAATMTIPDSFLWTTFGPLQCQVTETGGPCQGSDITCTVNYQPRPVELTLAGRYREGDGSLVFTQMRGTEAAGSASVQCCIRGVCMGHAAETPGGAGDLLAGSELAVALADGAALNIPPPGGIPGEWTMSLTLAYGGDGAGSASATGVAGLPLFGD